MIEIGAQDLDESEVDEKTPKVAKPKPLGEILNSPVRAKKSAA
jgi:hypothetical protein